MSCCRSNAVVWLGAVLCAVAVHASATSPVADAAEKMDHAAIRALVNEHADVNAAQVDGMTALHWAAYHDDREVAELLVKAGANVKAASRYGVTPLSLACTNGNAAVVDLWSPIGHFKFGGYFAWLFWLFAHIYFLIGFRNRIVVLIDWASAYWSKQRYARVVTDIAPARTLQDGSR